MNEMLIQDIILDMTESQLPIVYANQYDKDSRTVRCHIQDEGVDFDCSDYTIELWIKKSNGYVYSDTIVGENAIGSVSGNIVSFPILEKMTYSYGRQECKLTFISGNKKTSSHIFYIRVYESTEKNETVMDSDEYKTFHNEYLELKGLIEDLENNGGGGGTAEIPENVVLYAYDGEVTELPTSSEGYSIDDNLSTTSKNPVQNKVVTQAINDLNDKIDNFDGSGSITVDSELSTTSTNPVQNKVITARLNEVFQSVSNGKELVASAITDKGIPTVSDATFEEMAQNILRIPRGVSYVQINPQIEILPFTLIQEE